MRLTGIVQKLIDASIILKLPSSILGFILGLLEGYIVMFFIVAILSIPLRDSKIYQDSKVADTMMNNSPVLSSSIGKTLSSLSDIFVITTKVKKGDDVKTQINYNVITTYLNHDVISKEDALYIIDLGKLDSVPNIKEHVENYNS